MQDLAKAKDYHQVRKEIWVDLLANTMDGQSAVQCYLDKVGNIIGVDTA